VPHPSRSRWHGTRRPIEPGRCSPSGGLTLLTFFVIQFLYALAEEGLLRFDHDAACWFWNLDRIPAKGYTDNVVDLTVGKLAATEFEKAEYHFY
jgi:hypothetical protein